MDGENGNRNVGDTTPELSLLLLLLPPLTAAARDPSCPPKMAWHDSKNKRIERRGRNRGIGLVIVIILLSIVQNGVARLRCDELI